MSPVDESFVEKLEMHATELKEGMLFSKHELLDVESDEDYIDVHQPETPYDDMLTKAMNIESPANEEAPSSSFRNPIEKIKKIIANVQDAETVSYTHLTLPTKVTG